MRSSEHAVVGAAVSLTGALALRDAYGPPALALLVGYGLLLSVFIDLDHFVITRLRTGDWAHLRACLADPVWAFTAQEEVFAAVAEVMGYQRLLSHALLGGVLTVAGLAIGPGVGAFTAVVVYAHVLGDLFRESGLA